MGNPLLVTPSPPSARSILQQIAEQIAIFPLKELMGILGISEVSLEINSSLPSFSKLTGNPVAIAFAAEALANDRKPANRTGSFYTPPEAAAMIVDQAIEEWNKNNTRFPVVLDLACGTGMFLLQTVKKLLAGNASRTSISDAYSNLYGVDLNPLSCSLTKLLLLLQAKQLGASKKNCLTIASHLKNHIFCADALLSQILIDKNIDLIIGNPPYGLSRNNQLSPEENRLLKSSYSSARNGKINKYILFIWRALELISEGGIVSMLVPNSWLGIDGGRHVRSRLIESGDLLRISSFGSKLFRSLGVETIIFLAKKGAKTRVLTLAHFNSVTDPSPTTLQTIQTEHCRKDPSYKIPLRWGMACQKIMDVARKHTILLGSTASQLRPLIALQAYAFGKGSPPQTKQQISTHCFHSKEKLSDNSIRYLHGRDVSRYIINWSGEYLSHGPWLAEHQPISRYTGPRILLREILSSWPSLLSAAYTEETYLYNRSILHIIPNDNSSIPSENLAALTAVLNSKIGSILMLLIGKKSQRSLFPKIVLSDLREFPVPLTIFTQTSDVEFLSEAVQSLQSTKITADMRTTLESRINDCAFKLYHIDQELLIDATRELHLL